MLTCIVSMYISTWLRFGSFGLKLVLVSSIVGTGSGFGFRTTQTAIVDAKALYTSNSLHRYTRTHVHTHKILHTHTLTHTQRHCNTLFLRYTMLQYCIIPQFPNTHTHINVKLKNCEPNSTRRVTTFVQIRYVCACACFARALCAQSRKRPASPQHSNQRTSSCHSLWFILTHPPACPALC
jgi:hypothetical protein